jgi:hypothetical protein
MNMVKKATMEEKNMEEQKRNNDEEKKIESILAMAMIRICVYV